MKQQGWKTRRAEIVYFSLAKRRKIKGKQETTTRDSGNQAGLLGPGMDFPGAKTKFAAGHRAIVWRASLIVVSGTCGNTTPVTTRDLSMACNVHARYLLTTLTRIFLGSIRPDFKSLTGILGKFYSDSEGGS